MTTRYLTSIALTALMTAAGSLQAQSVRLAISPDSKLWIEGGSNLHGWSCNANSIDASVEVDSAFLSSASITPALVKRVLVKVPVRNLKCGHGGMDNNLYKALKADDSPDIIYVLSSFVVVPGTTKDSFTVKSVGALKIAGTEKTVDMEISALRTADGSIHADGALPLMMTDYGIKPPTAMFGTLHTDNKVTVKFSLLVGPQTLTAAAAGEPR
jgi:polyisoprenoid-binding protein YceI